MKEKFAAAFRGLACGLHHRSIVVQFILAVLAVTAGFILHLTRTEWVAVIICIGMVISAEILNTCVEKLCDLYSTSYSGRIKEIKDLAAAAVLTASIASLIVALVILFSHLGG